MVSNLGYVAVAAIELPRESIYVASMIESFTQGLGTAAFLSFLMNLCDKEHAASQYAILSALFALTPRRGRRLLRAWCRSLGLHRLLRGDHRHRGSGARAAATRQARGSGRAAPRPIPNRVDSLPVVRSGDESIPETAKSGELSLRERMSV